MTCYKPLKAWAPLSNVEGGRFVFDATKALNPDHPVKIPCGRCIGCRQDRVSDWMVRCVHESKVHESSWFVTLTYDDDHVPHDFSVKLQDVQRFMKRLRKRFGKGVRFLACGEYGERTLRPHYHFLLFNLSFPDLKFYVERDGYRVFKSDALAEVWPFGLHEIGSVTSESAGYCSQYVQKKRTGPVADDHYFRVSPVDGQAYRVAPEFGTMSRRPGLGYEWFQRFASDVFPCDHVVLNGTPRRTPVFYTKLLSEPEADRVKRLRKRLGLRYSGDHSGEHFRSAEKAGEHRTPDRLAVREFIHDSRLKRLVRAL